jgi:bifunctional ADP-heptose synthase (sugar kinase/adenylyltransferase)
VANHLAAFTKQVHLITDLGDRDTYENFIRENLRKNISWQYVVKPGSPTIRKTRFIDDYTKNKIFGVYDINDENIGTSQQSELSGWIEGMAPDYDLVIVLDYGHGLVTSSVVRTLENTSPYLAVNTQINSANIGFHTISKYQQCDFVCIHEEELRHEFRDRQSSIETLICKLPDRIQVGTIVITQGKSGVMASMDNTILHCPAYAGTIVDRVGAGDTLMGLTSLCFASKLPPEIGLLFGSLGASKMVGMMGTALRLDKEDILKTIKTMMS